MNRKRHSRALELFEQAEALPAEERETFLQTYRRVGIEPFKAALYAA